MMQENETEMNSVAKDEFPSQLAIQQDLNFQAKMRQFNMIGELSNWRRNMKNNNRRTQILAGYDKIMGICLGKV